jgi:hypothetical protein
MSIIQGPSFRANESIPAFVTVAVNASSTTDNLRCEVADTSASLPVGIIQDNVSTDGSANVVTTGLARMLVATTTAAGNLLTWQTATGQGMPIVDTSTITARLIAIALAPGTNGSIIPVLVNPQYIPNI